MDLKYSLSLILFVVALGVSGQGVLITDDSSETPESSAILELKSTSKGLLLPRLTGAEIEAIASPVAGLMVYNTTMTMAVVYDGSNWTTLSGEEASTTPEVGSIYGGGVIFYLDGTGQHGLIAALEDIDVSGTTTFIWGCRGTNTGATSNTDGAANTAAILAACSTSGIAAQVCDAYSVDMGGETYDDWYLPSIDQLVDMYALSNEIGGFDTMNYYWSSTQASSNNAYRVDWWNGSYTDRSKSNSYSVRPIRSF